MFLKYLSLYIHIYTFFIHAFLIYINYFCSNTSNIADGFCFKVYGVSQNLQGLLCARKLKLTENIIPFLFCFVEFITLCFVF